MRRSRRTRSPANAPNSLFVTEPKSVHQVAPRRDGDAPAPASQPVTEDGDHQFQSNIVVGFGTFLVA
jgi:hypothetical protein